MKSVCVLLAWSPNRDSRAQRTIRSMARLAEVAAFFPASPSERIDPAIFPPPARLFPVEVRRHPIDRVLQHSFFFLETRALIPAVLAQGRRYDLVYAHDLVTTYAGVRLARSLGARLVYDVHDLAVETINQLFPASGPMPKRLLYRSAMWTMRRTGRWWERRVIRAADAVITTNPSYRRYLEERYEAARCWVVPNYPELREVGRSRRLQEDLGLPDGAGVVLYHGVLGPGRNLDLIVRSAGFYADGNLLVVIGNGPLEAELKRTVSQRRLEAKVRFVDHVPYERLFDYVNGAHLGLALIEPINLSKEYALANKLTEYMAAGVAVLASRSPENVRLVGEASCGFVRDFETGEQLGAFVNEVTADRARLRELGENGKRAFRDRFNWSAQEQGFLEPIRRLLGEVG